MTLLSFVACWVRGAPWTRVAGCAALGLLGAPSLLRSDALHVAAVQTSSAHSAEVQSADVKWSGADDASNERDAFAVADSTARNAERASSAPRRASWRATTVRYEFETASAASSTRSSSRRVTHVEAQRAVLAPVGRAEHERAVYVSRELTTPFRELLLSWNVVCPPHASFTVELRVAERDAWSEWMTLDAWQERAPLERVTACEGGRIDVDVFRGTRDFRRAQFRIVAASDVAAEVVIERVTVCFSHASSAPADAEPARASASRACALDVAPRSQRAEAQSIASRVCSPTSLAMVMAYRGVDETTAAVAARAFDPAHDLYGHWPRNVQTAFSFGVPGYVTRFFDWDEVERIVCAGQPLVISIGVRAGQLRGAPYESTPGHLIVITGFDGERVLVNDPAAPKRESVRRSYARSELHHVWMERGGVAYVLLPR